MPGTPRRSRTSRSPTATSAGASPSPSTWCSPGSSPAPPWRPPTSKWVSGERSWDRKTTCLAAEAILFLIIVVSNTLINERGVQNFSWRSQAVWGTSDPWN
uniref:Uncharacterized protein n=1 Tax=Zonotrichia albicollis TaxID=44394 RepID=A0A8D2LZZ5_ZONAL